MANKIIYIKLFCKSSQNDSKMNEEDLKSMSNAIRCLSLDAIAKANSGHPGMPLGFADVATVLFSKYLKFLPSKPNWADRDRFVLSAGHGSMLLYSLLYLTGYRDCSLEQIKNFRQFGAKTAGHPEYKHLNGIETTTGPLGQGVANAVGMVIAERHLNAVFGNEIVNHKTYCVVGDGCLMEGISYEALAIAGNLRLKNLIVMWDDNRITIDGNTDIARNEDMKKRMESIDFLYLEANGHDYDSIDKALATAQNSDKPVFIDFKTKIGFGSPKEGTNKCHGSPLKGEELLETKRKLGCKNWKEFEIPEEILKLWRGVGLKNKGYFAIWKQNLEKSDKFLEFGRIIKGELPNDLDTKFREFKDKILKEHAAEATRKSSQKVLEFLTENIPELIGGSADLTTSVLTSTTSTSKSITRDDYSGRYINYGIREHAMVAIMNGLALHGGVIPYAGTFMCFSDYEKPAIRLASLMGLRCLFIFTHDSIGLGEDGPTHQPIEHLASLRAIPNLNVFRPADVQETLDCYEVAMQNKYTPSAMILSRQSLSFIENKPKENLVKKGAYVLIKDKKATVTIMTSGSELALALDVMNRLKLNNVKVRIVSAPCLNIFDRQSDKYKNVVLAKDTLRVAIEAASSYGWHKYIGENGMFFGIPDDRFGISAPAERIYEYFGLTGEKISGKILERLKMG